MSRLLAGERSGALFEEVGDSFFEILALQALEHFLFGGFECFDKD